MLRAEPVSYTHLYDEIIKGTELLDDEDVPDTGRVLTVVPEVYRMMKKCPDLSLDCDVTEKQRLNGVIAMVDGMDVVKISKKRMPANAGFMICHPVATVAPTKLEDYRVHQDPPGISGELVEGRIVYDAFVLDNKRKAIYYVAVSYTHLDVYKRQVQRGQQRERAVPGRDTQGKQSSGRNLD